MNYYECVQSKYWCLAVSPVQKLGGSQRWSCSIRPRLIDWPGNRSCAQVDRSRLATSIGQSVRPTDGQLSTVEHISCGLSWMVECFIVFPWILLCRGHLPGASRQAHLPARARAPLCSLGNPQLDWLANAPRCRCLPLQASFCVHASNSPRSKLVDVDWRFHFRRPPFRCFLLFPDFDLNNDRGNIDNLLHV